MARKFAKKIYNSKKWKKCRKYIYDKYYGLCADCGKPGLEVHHDQYLTPDNINDPDIVYGEWNLILLCRDCHFARRPMRKQAIDNDYYFDEDGNMCQKEIEAVAIDAKVYIVYGSPGSGKSRHVKDHMVVGDMVVDLDLIAQSIGLQGKTETPLGLLDTVISIREHMYGMIAQRNVKCESVWVIAGLPKRYERDELSKRLRADDLIFMDVSKDECIERAMNDKERTDKDKQYQIIYRWFNEFEK